VAVQHVLWGSTSKMSSDRSSAAAAWQLASRHLCRVGGDVMRRLAAGATGSWSNAAGTDQNHREGLAGCRGFTRQRSWWLVVVMADHSDNCIGGMVCRIRAREWRCSYVQLMLTSLVPASWGLLSGKAGLMHVRLVWSLLPEVWGNGAQ
jgi:hypothetical protein